MKFFLMIFTFLIALSGCMHERVIYKERVENPSDDIATQEPPRVIEERVVVAPSPMHVWIAGHWAWRRGAYAWAPGYWAPRPRPRAYWALGGWIRFGGGWRWRNGYWH